MYVLLGIVAVLGAAWKLLGRLLHPVLKKWLSQDVSLGFIHLVSLSRASLEQAALDAITNALRTSLPVRAAEVHISRLTLSVGFVVGLRLRANGVKVILEWLPEDNWDEAAESIEAQVQGKSAVDAKAGIALVQNKQSPMCLVPSFIAGFLESVISSGWICMDGFELSLRGGHGEAGPDVSVMASLRLSTSRCRAIEWRGTRARGSLELAVSAGGQQLISPAKVQLTVTLPKVLQTLLMPRSSPKKQVQLEASLKKLTMTAHPTALCALMQANGYLSRFGEWTASVEQMCSEVTPLGPGDREAYVEALIKGEDVAKWERNMTSAEILRVYSDWKHWEVPAPLTLEEWLEQLQEEQKPVRSIEASVAIDSIAFEARGEDTSPGDGFAMSSSKLKLEAHVLDVAAAPAPSAEGASEEQAAQEGPMKVRADVSLSRLSLTCDANDVFAMPVLEPCDFVAKCSLHQLGYKTTLHATTQFQRAASEGAVQHQRPEAEVIVATISSRSVWKLQSVLSELTDAMQGAEDQEVERPKEPQMQTVANKRRKEHQEELEKVFRKLDADGSGSLERDEVHALVASMYGDHMTKKELALAGNQLFDTLDIDGSGSIGLDEIQTFFGRTSNDAAVGMVCLRLYEFTLPVKPDLDAVHAFGDMAGTDAAAASSDETAVYLKPGVLQLQWVRTLQNYKEAKRTWEADIAPTLAPRFRDWKLRDNMLAIDFWNDPTFSLTGHKAADTKRDFAAVLRVQLAGISLRLADSQHCCSIPRVRVDMERASLEGGVHMLSARMIPWCEGVSAELNLSGAYWNERAMSAEPFIEPWKVSLRAQGDDISLRATDHLVVNVTPPFLQAVTVAAASLQDLQGEYSTEVDDRFVVAWVVNATNCDIKVCARGPAGQGSPVTILSGHYAKRVPVEIRGAKEGASLRLQNSNDSWTLAIEGRDSSGAWSIDEGIDFSITGRQLFRAGDRVLAATTSVDVHSLAPLLTLSGTTTLTNLTMKTLTLSDGGQYNVTVGPGQSWKAAIGGGLRLSLPIARDGQEQPVVVDMPEDGGDDANGDVTTWRIEHGYRFILYQREDRPRNAAQGALAKDWTLVCIPMLSILNALPSCLYCIMANALADDKPGDLGPPIDAGLPVAVDPGGTIACDDIDPDKPVKVAVELNGVRYHAVIPEDVLKRKQGVLRLQNATRRRRGRNAVVLHCETPEAYSTRTGMEASAFPEAPLLDVEFSWENESAVLIVYSRYWLANKTGWKIQGSSQMNVRRAVGMKGETATPAPLEDVFQTYGPRSRGPNDAGGRQRGSAADAGIGRRGSTLDPRSSRRGSSPDPRGSSPERVSAASSDAARARVLPGSISNASISTAPGAPSSEPEVALMRLESNQLHVKLHWEPSSELWSWDMRREQCSLVHWIGDEAEKANQTGWSSALAVEFSGTTGVAELPRSDDHVVQVAGVASAVLGVSVTDLPVPFQRTKLITVLPRYVVRNDFDEAVQLWPSVGASRCAPLDESPEGLPIVQPGGCLAIDAMPYSSSILSAARTRELPMVSVRSCSQGGAQGTGPWSLQVHLSMVGDTTFTVGTGDPGDPIRVVRASVQRSEATIFVILVRGRWPCGIENHSLVHTVAFHQVGAEGLAEWVLNPCESRNFVLPDPDRPKHLLGRICGAGQSMCQRYEMNDLSRTEQLPPLKVFGHNRDVALEVTTRMKAGHTQLLVVSDPKPQEALERGQSQLQKKPTGAPREGTGGIMKLSLDVFLAGVHMCLIDTRGPSPVEMLAFTVDYIQLQKKKKQRAVTFTIHSIQLDDFGQDDRFVFGPAMSGLNSQRYAAAAVNTKFVSRPLLEVSIVGPRNPFNPVYDPERGMLSLQGVHLNFQPVEANVDLPRLVALGMGLKGWLSVIDWGVAGSSAQASVRNLRRSLAPGFATPQRGGDKVCYVALLRAEAVSLVVDVKLNKRAGDKGGKEDLEDEALQIQLNQLSQRVWKPLRFIIDFFARMGTAFAEASPRFKFSELKLPHLNGNLNVVKASVAAHYQSQVVAQVAKTFGSLQVLGDPVNLLDDISSSFTTFLQKTKEEIQGDRLTLGEGVGDLTGGVFGGALGSVSKVSGSLKDMVGSVTGRPIGSNKRANNISDGIDLGLMSLAAGISEAVTGLVEDPMQQAATNGISGFCKGSLQGTAGLFTRPMEGFLGAVEKFAQGAEHQVRGVHRGYGGLRRPPRVNFRPRARGLQKLDQAFFWPQWRMRVVSVSLPVLWKERKVQQLVVLPQQADASTGNEVSIVRGEAVNTWALQGQSPENDFAVGRTGSLRGPFRLQVDAMVEGNLEMTKWFRVTVGYGELPLEDLVRCLGTCTAPALTFNVRAQRSAVLGEAFAAQQGEVMGEIVVELTPDISEAIMPRRFTTEADEDLETLGPAGEVLGLLKSPQESIRAIARAALATIGRLPVQLPVPPVPLPLPGITTG